MFVPLVAYVIAEGSRPVLATVLLVLFGTTDWVDGFLARRLHQTSRVGEILDPLADRAGIVLICVAMLLAGVLPWWALVVLVATDAVVTVVGVVRRHAIGALNVVWVGKIRTAVLMVSLPLLTLSTADLAFAPTLATIGMALLVVGCVLHLAAGAAYMSRLIRTPRPDVDGATPGPGK